MTIVFDQGRARWFEKWSDVCSSGCNDNDDPNHDNTVIVTLPDPAARHALRAPRVTVAASRR